MFGYLRRLPIWIWGALCAIILIALSTRGRLDSSQEALRLIFAAQPPSVERPFTPPRPFDLASLPVELQQAARDLLALLDTGSAGRPLEPVAETARLRIEIDQLQPVEGGLMVVGTITNRSSSELLVPISAFELRDSSGVSYLAGGGASTRLGPGTSTPLELSITLPPGRGLLLITTLPPDPPVEQRLLVAEE